MMLLKMSVVALGFLIAPLYSCAETYTETTSVRDNRDGNTLSAYVCVAGQWLCKLCAGYLTVAALTIIHELGHALANYILWHDPVHINFGVSVARNPQSPLLKTRFFTLWGFCIAGWINRNAHNDPFKEIISCCAGPMTGLLGVVAVKKALDFFAMNTIVTELALIYRALFEVMSVTRIDDNSVDGYRALYYLWVLRRKKDRFDFQRLVRLSRPLNMVIVLLFIGQFARSVYVWNRDVAI